MSFLFHDCSDTRKIIYASYTDKGNRLGVNQDSVLALCRGNIALFCVADGMGGHSNGEIASSEIVKVLSNWYLCTSNPNDCSPNILFDEVEKIIEEVNDGLYQKYNNNRVCGSTIVVLIIFKDMFAVISAGDSRCYKRNKWTLQQITKDDVWSGTETDPEYQQKRGKLLKAVGVKEGLICNRITGKLKRHDLFFLCSDGIYKVIGNDFFNRIVRTTFFANSEIKLQTALDSIHNLVNEQGAPDNNTGIIVKLL